MPATAAAMNDGSMVISRNGRPPPTNAGVAGRGNSTKYSRTAEARNSTRISA